MVFITKSYQDLFGVRSYINAKIKQIKNSNAYENIDLGSLQVWSGCLYIQFGVRNESLLP